MARTRSGPLRTLIGRRRAIVTTKVELAYALLRSIEGDQVNRVEEQLILDYGCLHETRKDLLVALTKLEKDHDEFYRMAKDDDAVGAEYTKYMDSPDTSITPIIQEAKETLHVLDTYIDQCQSEAHERNILLPENEDEASTVRSVPSSSAVFQEKKREERKELKIAAEPQLVHVTPTPVFEERRPFPRPQLVPRPTPASHPRPLPLPRLPSTTTTPPVLSVPTHVPDITLEPYHQPNTTPQYFLQ